MSTLSIKKINILTFTSKKKKLVMCFRSKYRSNWWNVF